MIKTYKQWMQTMYESVQALNEEANPKADVSQFFSQYYEFFTKFETGQGKSAKIFNTKWSQTANAASKKFGERGGDSLRKRALNRLKNLLKRARKSEVTKDRRGGSTRLYAEIYGNEDPRSNEVKAIIGTNPSGKHKNAQGGMVQLDGGVGLPATLEGRDKARRVNIYDLCHEINMKNLSLVGLAVNNLSTLSDDVYPSVKSVSKGFNEDELEQFKEKCGRIKCITEITGSSIGVGSLKQSDEVSGLNRESIYIDKTNKLARIDFPLYYVYGYFPGAGETITDGKVIYKTIETKGPDSVSDYSIPIAGIDKMFAQGSPTLNDGYDAKLAATLKKTLEQFDAITSIVVKGGASYEWSGTSRDDAKNKNLAEQRAQTVMKMIKAKYSNLAVSTAGAEAAVIQPDEDDSKREQYRKVYLDIKGHKVTPGEVKEVTIKEVETAAFKKDTVRINSKIMSISVDIRN